MKRLAVACVLALVIPAAAFASPAEERKHGETTIVTATDDHRVTPQETADEFPDGLPRISRLQIRPTVGKCYATMCSNYQYCSENGYNCNYDSMPFGCYITGGPWVQGLGCQCAGC